ncbi:HAD family hydrolase [Candidatus Marimicrobium litorale]|uniref:HAD family hydrolase n=1 Tax=Candidatus Marimicrobium litorale TaxID=2518991 RepID=UPI00242D37F5|nr:HAD family hydrolase [Candidatus Marimicrobium litorale]
MTTRILGRNVARRTELTISVITFDLDNTLWDVEPALLRAEEAQRQWLITHRPGAIEVFDHDALFEFKKAVWKRHPQLVHNVTQMRLQTLYELLLIADYSETEASSGASEAFAVFLAERHKVVLYEEALSILETLARSYTLGALTNGNADIYKTDAAEYFDFAFLAEDIGRAKPHPDMFQAALDKTGVKADQIIHVGDDPDHDVQGANAIGMRSVWVNLRGKLWPGGTRADEEIEKLQALPAAIARIAAMP